MPAESDQAVLVTLLLQDASARLIFLFEELRKVVAATTATTNRRDIRQCGTAKNAMFFCVTMDVKTTVSGSTISNTAHPAKPNWATQHRHIYFMYTFTMTKWSLFSLSLSPLSIALSLSACTHHLVNHILYISPCTLGCFKIQKRNLAKHWSMNKQTNTGGRGRLLTKLMVQLWRRDRPLRYVYNCRLPFHSCPVRFALRSIQDRFHTVFKPSPECPVSSALIAWFKGQTTRGHEPIVRRSSTLVMRRSRARKIFGCYAFPGTGNIGY